MSPLQSFSCATKPNYHPRPCALAMAVVFNHSREVLPEPLLLVVAATLWQKNCCRFACAHVRKKQINFKFDSKLNLRRRRPFGLPPIHGGLQLGQGTLHVWQWRTVGRAAVCVLNRRTARGEHVRAPAYIPKTNKHKPRKKSNDAQGHNEVVNHF